MTAESVKRNKLTKVTPKQKHIINLHNQYPNASGREIARLANADPSYTLDILQRYGLIEQVTSDYKVHRADILAGLQHRLISSITHEDIKKAPLGSRILAAAQLYDKERIERGLSNGDQPIMVIIRDKPQPIQVEGSVIDVTPAPTNAE